MSSVVKLPTDPLSGIYTVEVLNYTDSFPPHSFIRVIVDGADYYYGFYPQSLFIIF